MASSGALCFPHFHGFTTKGLSHSTAHYEVAAIVHSSRSGPVPSPPATAFAVFIATFR